MYIGGPSSTFGNHNTRHILARTPRTRHQQHENEHQYQHGHGGGAGGGGGCKSHGSSSSTSSQSTATAVGRQHQHPAMPPQNPAVSRISVVPRNSAGSRNSAFSRNSAYSRNPAVWADYFAASSSGEAAHVRAAVKGSTASPLQQEMAAAQTRPNSGFESSSSFGSIRGEEAARVGGSTWMKVSNNNRAIVQLSLIHI